MKRLCVICARAGSKGVPGKNLRPLAGKPLIAHSIDQAHRSGMFDWVAVSSDGAEILEAAKAWGADHLVERPPELARDTAPKIPAIRHCAATVEERMDETYDVVADLDATAPLRSVEDIQGAVRLLEKSGAQIVVSGAPARRSPYFNLVELDAGGGVRLSKTPERPIERRQDAPACYDLNASVYVWRRTRLFSDDALLGPETRLFVMPEERSFDIDSELDFRIVECLMAQDSGEQGASKA